MSADSVTVETVVHVDPITAFEIFTEEVDAWWRRGPRFRALGGQPSVLRFEPGVGGRLIESRDDDVFELGRISAWEPGERLAFDLGGRDFGIDDPRSEVDIRFEEHPSGTRVVLTNFGFDAMADDHPVRHGQLGGALTQMMGMWWADLLTSLRTQTTKSRD